MRFISFPLFLSLALGTVMGGCKGSGGDADGGRGGAISSGGATGTGGATGSGGVRASGGGSGGAAENGGASGSGGIPATGGTRTETTGAGGSGGVGGAGGTSATGGSTAVGGSGGRDDGGAADVPSTDGSLPDRPAGTGGTRTGGTTATGGAATGGATGTGGGAGLGCTGTGGTRAACAAPSCYRNLFVEILGKTQADVDTKLDKMFQQLFHGTADQKIYYEGPAADQAQIYDVASGDVRSEGQSYGMMIAVMLDKQAELDKLWRYAASCMRQPNGLFAWKMKQGACTALETGVAPDGDEYFATALMLASRRWGDGGGIDYASEAKQSLAAMATQKIFSQDPACVYYTVNSGNSDASYVLPLFYAEWACFDTANADLWSKAATHARGTFFHNACNQSTGLASERSDLSGKPQDTFGPDAWRVPMNIMMDYNLDNVDADWQTSYAKTHAAFWIKEGLTSYGDRYTLDGQKQNPGHGPGQDAINAMLAFALPPGDANAKALLQRAWDVPLQTGTQRYYNGCLQMLAFLHLGGKFQLFYR